MEEANQADANNRKTSAVRCRIRIKGNPTIAVLDSGAAVSIITKRLMHKLGLKINQTSNVQVITANGECIRALKQISNVKIIIQNISIPISLQVIESPNEILLLGTNWFTKTHASLDFGDQKITL